MIKPCMFTKYNNVLSKMDLSEGLSPYSKEIVHMQTTITKKFTLDFITDILPTQWVIMLQPVQV